jgi:hypothetical protein
VYLIIWVLGIIGVPIPPKVVQILWVIVALVAILLLVRMLPLKMGAADPHGNTVVYANR